MANEVGVASIEKKSGSLGVRDRWGTPRHEVDVNGRHTIITDEPERLGGTDAGPTPHELMAAMLAACASAMIVLYAQCGDWHVGDVRMDVSYDADVTARRVDIEVHLPEGLRPEQIERLRRVGPWGGAVFALACVVR